MKAVKGFRVLLLSLPLYSLIFFPYNAINALDAIYLKPRAVVENSSVNLSDIARLPKGMLDVIIFPLPEEPSQLTPALIKEKLPEGYSDFSVLGSNTLLIPLSRSFSKDEIQESLLSEILHKTKMSEDSLRLSYDGEEVHLPGKGVDIKWGGFPNRLTPGKKIFSLDVWFKGQRIYSKRLTFLVEYKITAIATKRHIQRLSVFNADDIEVKEFFTSENPSDLIIDKIIGMTALTNLKAGELIRKKHVRNVFTIERGSEVEIVYFSDNIVVKGKGTAKESGNTGDMVQVLSKSSKTMLKGKVSEKGWVVVE
jgi:flagella basal body P-ring formation protein FlgA